MFQALRPDVRLRERAPCAPMVPVTLTGTRTPLRGQELQPRYSKLQVLVGEPIPAHGEDWQAALQLRDAARGWILARLVEPDMVA